MANLTLAFILVWTSLAMAAKLPEAPDHLEDMIETERVLALATGNSTDDDSTDRIIGGFRVRSPRMLPFMARVEGHRRNKKFKECGGTIIAYNWVLTAAHCISEEDSDDPKTDIVSVFVRAGSVYPKRGGEYVKAARFWPHPKWAGFKKGGAFDIGMIKLSKRLKYSDTIQPVLIQLPGFVPPVGTRYITAGWGYTRAGAGDSKSPILKAVSVTVQRCLFFPTNAPSKDSTFCAWGTLGTNGDSNLALPARHCKGDSGGFVGYYSVKDHRYKVVGVVSFTYPEGTCYNNGMTNVSYFTEKFIFKTIRDNP